MRRCLVLVIALSLVISAFAQKKKKKSDMPMPVVAAQFVYITSLHGDIYNPNTTAIERAAMQKVEDALRAWGKYRIMYQPQGADLMLIVKPGAIAEGRTGVDVGTMPPDPNYPGVRLGGGMPTAGQMGGISVSSTSDDMLLVSLTPTESPDTAPTVWRRSAHHGFSGNKPALVEAFRDAVDEAAKQDAKP